MSNEAIKHAKEHFGRLLEEQIARIEQMKRGEEPLDFESANVSMRKELDLFANVRPVRVPEQGIDWTFFRENTEDLYALGSDGINVTDDLAIDFKVMTTQGCERIIRMAFEFASRNSI